MRFSTYFDTVCYSKGVTSIRKAAAFFQIGKSGVERIKAGECDIPTENMLNKVSVISGESVEDLYQKLEYLPIYSSCGLNKRVKEIIDYRDTHLPDGREMLPYAREWLGNYYRNMVHKSFDMWDGDHILSSPSSPSAKPDFYVFMDGKQIAFEHFQHYSSGNVILSSDQCFNIHISRMLSMEGIKEYVLICTNDKEAEYLRQSNNHKILNTSVKIRIAFYAKEIDGFMPLRLEQTPYR